MIKIIGIFCCIILFMLLLTPFFIECVIRICMVQPIEYLRTGRSMATSNSITGELILKLETIFKI